MKNHQFNLFFSIIYFMYCIQITMDSKKQFGKVKDKLFKKILNF